HGVPPPHGVGEVEGRDDADRAEWEPLLKHAVTGALGREDLARKLPRQPDREIGDVDRLLHLAEALGPDLAHFQGDQLAKRLLDLAIRLTDGADDLTAFRGRDFTPAAERLDRRGGSGLVLSGSVESDARDGPARGR